jgi:hypothetical protein
MTAVANHAGREMRRRGRKPTVSLENVIESTSDAASPDEAAAHAEEASLTREIIGSLPPRRRAVLMYRYGWDLEPSEVCSLVEGLSPRAYRKEIERGVAEVAKKMRLADEGGWCESREPLLRAVVAGEADEEQERQAQRHLSNCRSCATFVGKLSGHLHEVGGGIAFAGLADGAGVDTASLLDRGVAVVDRVKSSIGSAVGRGSETVEQAAGPALTSGGTRGAGVAGAGALAKIAGFGAVPKLVAACIGTGAAATACVAAGVLPGVDREREPRPEPKPVREVDASPRETGRHAALTRLDEVPPPTPQPDPPQPDSAEPIPPGPATPEPAASVPTSEAPPPAEPPPAVQDFEQIGVPVGGSPTPTGSSGSGGGSAAGGEDFGP